MENPPRQTHQRLIDLLNEAQKIFRANQQVLARYRALLSDPRDARQINDEKKLSKPPR
jgi:hypothetical protein